MVALDGAGKSAPLRLADHVDQVSVGKLIDKNLVAHIHLAGGFIQAKFFKNAGRRNSTTCLLKVSPHRLGDVLQFRRSLINQADLHRVITISPGRRLLLYYDAWSSLDDRHRCNSAIRRENLRHADFSSDDSVNHWFNSNLKIAECYSGSLEFSLQAALFHRQAKA